MQSSASLLAATVSFPVSPFPPLAAGFMGLGTGYLIYGPQELSGWPRRDRSVDLGTGVRGLRMPGFMQFITGIYLFPGLSIFHTVTAPPLCMAALAFTVYGVHWFAIGWIRMAGSGHRVNAGMTAAFAIISVLGLIVFFKAGDPRSGGCSSG